MRKEKKVYTLDPFQQSSAAQSAAPEEE